MNAFRRSIEFIFLFSASSSNKLRFAFLALKVVSQAFTLKFKTIRITRTLIRDNTHDLNDTRGHSFY